MRTAPLAVPTTCLSAPAHCFTNVHDASQKRSCASAKWRRSDTPRIPRQSAHERLAHGGRCTHGRVGRAEVGRAEREHAVGYHAEVARADAARVQREHVEDERAE